MTDLVRHRRRPPEVLRYADDNRPTKQSIALLPGDCAFDEGFKGELRQRLERQVNRGEIEVIVEPYPLNASRNNFRLYGAVVLRRKQARPRWVMPVALIGVALGVLFGLGWLLYTATKAIVAGVATAATNIGGGLVGLVILFFVISSLIKGHPCPGLHCSSCKGGH